MVRWTLQSPWLDVDRRCAATQRELGADQDMVDAQAEIAFEPVHSVVPPGERFLTLGKQPETVFQSQSKELPKGFPFPGAAQDLAFPQLRVVDVLIGGCGVVVAPPPGPRALFLLFFLPPPPSRAPVVLVLPFFSSPS